MSLREKLFSKQFCLWLVPAGSGTVKKFRFSARRALLCILIVLTVSTSLLYVAGDYVRLQMVRVQEALSFNNLKKRHAQLTSEADQLAARVAALKSQRDSLENRQVAVKARVLELHALLAEMKESGLLSDFELPEISDEKADAVSDVGIGGHEEPHPEQDEKAKNQATGEDADSGIGGMESALGSHGMDGATLGAPASLKFPGTPEGPGLVFELDRVIHRLKKLPIGFPGNGHVNSEYGPRRSPFSRRMRMHQGVDMALPYGSFVYATADGTIKSVKRTRSYGLVIDIEHADGVVTRYAHLSKALVRAGETICRGENVGLVGNSGMSTGPHLHYEVRVNGEAIDPLPLMLIPSKIDFGSVL